MTPRSITEIAFAELMTLEPHGPDTFVAEAARYPWGTRLFGGQVVAQALRAGIATVDPLRHVHSLHSYFIRPGSHDEPVRFEVERLRDGRSFCTRQVVARQSSGAILNLSASFQVAEEQPDVHAEVGAVPDPDDPALNDQSWGALLQRRSIRLDDGRIGFWIRLDTDIGDAPILHACGLAFMSDSAPAWPARSIHPAFDGDMRNRDQFQLASLDHTVWFHRPTVASDWHWFETRPHGLSGGRGVVSADVFRNGDEHVATIAQQVLVRHRSPA
ncbi:MAG: acyl-CoA thioesterase domain-containing protein [Actinomycetota bacterium]